MESVAALLFIALCMFCVLYIPKSLDKQASLRRGNHLLQLRIEALNSSISALESENSILKAHIKCLKEIAETNEILTKSSKPIDKLQMINIEVLSIIPNNPKDLK